ncbi:MAG: DUF4144 family protein [Gammaproteobacteria bacterium]|nr:DUF4144 family protein [Gammaproteobacteria bacterium]
MLNIPSIHWPGIVKHKNDDELTLLQNETQWKQYIHQYAEDDDWLIDASGYRYYLQQNDQSGYEYHPGDQLNLVQVLGLVKAHAALNGSCCVAKLYAPTFEAAYKIIEAMQAEER